MTQLVVISIYLMMLLGLGIFSGKLFRGTSKDFMLASHSIGPFMLLMSLFGTTMTAFALVGSTGEAFKPGSMACWRPPVASFTHSAFLCWVSNSGASDANTATPHKSSFFEIDWKVTELGSCCSPSWLAW